MLGSPCNTCRTIRPPHADQPAAEGKPRWAPAPPNERSSRAPGLSWSATRSSWPLPTTSHDDGQVQTETSAGPAPPAPASRTRRRLRQTTSRAWTQRATTPTPAIPAVRLPAPPPRSRTSLRPDTADAATLRHRTPTPDAHTGPRTADAHTGPRTADTWTLGWHRTPVTRRWDRQAWTLDARTGHRTPDTGHWTLAEDADRVTTARPASGPPGPPRRATARWDAQPYSCGRRLRALDSPCRLGGEAAFQREIASRRQLLGRSGGVERRLGALLSSDDFGSSVERTAKLHPLWRGQRWGAGRGAPGNGIVINVGLMAALTCTNDQVRAS
jgi:hypothetical protein